MLLDKNLQLINHSIIVGRTASWTESIAAIKVQLAPLQYDIYTYNSDNALLSVEQLRSIQDQLILSVDKPRVVVIRADKFPLITQNAMLKMLEDGYEKTIIIVVVPAGQRLLPTINSRVSVVNLGLRIERKEVDNWITLNLSDRIDYLQKLIDEGSFSDFYYQIAMLTNDARELASHNQAFVGWQKGVITNKVITEYISMMV